MLLSKHGLGPTGEETHPSVQARKGSFESGIEGTNHTLFLSVVENIGAVTSRDVPTVLTTLLIR